MAFKRALWHSGLTYQMQCTTCRTLVRYTDYSLDFRPWYPNGFVYCPKCKTPLRHNELYAINPDGSPYYPQPVPAPAPAYTPPQQETDTSVTYRFCNICGNRYVLGKDHFCSACGNKLD